MKLVRVLGFLLLTLTLNPAWATGLSAPAYDFEREFRENIPGLCNNLMATRFVTANKKYFTEQLGMNASDPTEAAASLQNFAMEDLGKMLFYTGQKMDAWTLSLIPSAEIRRRSLVYALNFKFPVRSDTRGGGFDPLRNVETYSSGVPANSALNNEHVAVGISVLDRLIQDYSTHPRPARTKARERDGISEHTDARGLGRAFLSIQNSFGGNFALSAAFCVDILGYSTLNCAGELNALIGLTAKDVKYQTIPGVEGDVILLNHSNYADLLENPKHVVPLLFAAKKVLRRFQAGTTGHASFYDDLKESFIESGLKEAEAEELKWRVVGVMGTAGANLVTRLRHYTNGYRGSRYALSLMAGALPYLDHVSSQMGMNIYSFPKTVKATCNSGKSYHFMMAAYLSRTLVKQGLDPRKSAAMVYQFAKAYNGPYRDFLKGAQTSSKVKSDSAAGDVIRIDLSYGASGAVYGAFEGIKTKSAYDVDETLSYLYGQRGQGKLLLPLPDFQILSGVKSYVEAFNPNAAFEISLERAINQKDGK